MGMNAQAKTGPIRVLHIITRMIQGGAQENTLLTVEGLNQKGRFQASLVSGIDRGPEGELLSRVPRNTRLIIVPELGRSINPFADLRALFKLYHIIRSGHYHIVHTHSSKAGVLGRIAARFARTPFIVHTIHGLAFHDYQPWVANWLCRLVKRGCARITDHYISVSSNISSKALLAGIGKPSKFTTIYSGMELDWFLHAEVNPLETRRQLGISPDAPVVGKIARLFPLKGHQQLLEAIPSILSRHPAVRFLLVGNGILYERLRNRARDLGVLDSLVFAGLVPRERIPEMLSVMDILVHTSLREGLARALPQALAMGKPCVSFDLDGAPEVILQDQTGFLVKPGDSVALADAISRLISDPGLRSKMGTAGRRLVDPMFRAETMVERTIEVYTRLLQADPERLRKFDNLA